MKPDILIFFQLVILCSFAVNVINGARGGGGGGSRSGGSRFSSSRSSFRSGSYRSGYRYGSGSYYRSGYGGKWYDSTSGLYAYGLMTGLALRGPSETGDSKVYQTQYRNKLSSKMCTNLQDFNGTVFGSFNCPLDTFPDDHIYCCGSGNYQYCCDRDSSPWLSLAIIGILFLLLSPIYIIYRSGRKDILRHPLKSICSCFKKPKSESPDDDESMKIEMKPNADAEIKKELSASNPNIPNVVIAGDTVPSYVDATNSDQIQVEKEGLLIKKL